MSGLAFALIVFTSLIWACLVALRLIVVDILRARKISHRFDNPMPLNFSDDLAWAIFRINQEQISRRERLLCRLYSLFWFSAIVLLLTTVIVAFVTKS